MKTMYKGIPFSPRATLTQEINGSATVIPVSDVNAFPEAPNLATIGTDDAAETILYSAKTENALSGCTRGVEGSAKTWSAGSIIARNFTAVEYGYIIDNIQQLFNEQEFTARINEEGHLIITLGTGTEIDCGNAKGDRGPTGPAGYTPQKGTDYFTTEDVQSIVEELKKVALLLTGGTMTGPLILNGDPSESLGAATKQYADKKAEKVPGATDGNIATLTEDGGIKDSGKAATPEGIGSVPTSRSVNGKPLSSDIDLTAADINAANALLLRTATLTASGWSNKVQSVTVPGVIVGSTNQVVRISPADKSSAEAWSESGVWCTTQGLNKLTFTCDSVPNVDININIDLQEVAV